MLVSLIIPVYNVEKFLDRCFESVKDQSYHDIEIILVDDGSTDSSGRKCDEYAKQDSRVIVIHKTNGGLSSARNSGLKVAKGKYVSFLDSDDYIAPDFIKKTVSVCENNGAQIAIMKMCYIAESTNECVEEATDGRLHFFTPENAIEESLYQELYTCCAPSKMYLRDTIEGINFPVGKLSEDLATCHLFLSKASKVVYVDEIGYYYRQRSNSIMHDFNPRRLDAIEWTREIENFCEKKYPEIINAAYCRSFNVAIHLLLELPSKGEMHDSYYPIIWKEIVRTRRNVLKNTKARKRERAASLLSFFGEKVLRIVWNSGVSVKRKEN